MVGSRHSISLGELIFVYRPTRDAPTWIHLRSGNECSCRTFSIHYAIRARSILLLRKVHRRIMPVIRPANIRRCTSGLEGRRTHLSTQIRFDTSSSCLIAVWRLWTHNCLPIYDLKISRQRFMPSHVSPLRSLTFSHFPAHWPKHVSSCFDPLCMHASTGSSASALGFPSRVWCTPKCSMCNRSTSSHERRSNEFSQVRKELLPISHCFVKQSLCSPMRLLRTFPPLEALPVIGIAVTLVRDLPTELYDELVKHPYEIQAA